MKIIIPCYNEYQKIDKIKYIQFLQNQKDVSIVFSEDGSTDGTLKTLKEIQQACTSQVHICISTQNNGKAEAIRKAVLFCYDEGLEFNKIAYLDADLSVSLEECYSISRLINKDILFAFGSRISKVDNTITRSQFRHLSGRFVATMISNLLGIAVYDTQCGCKVFDARLAKTVFADAFISRWLFDVEILFRIIKLYSRKELKNMALEIPLQSWIDAGDSKVKLSYFIKMWYDLYLIKKQYGEINN
jgi:glycosyltransferase involved in cell wall biosynthesis